jgi:hypothetical protein
MDAADSNGHPPASYDVSILGGLGDFQHDRNLPERVERGPTQWRQAAY